MEMHLSWNVVMIGIIIHSDNDIYMSMMSIVIPDYRGAIDIFVILTYTENNTMVPERMAARLQFSWRRNYHRRTNLLREATSRSLGDEETFTRYEAKRQEAKTP